MSLEDRVLVMEEFLRNFVSEVWARFDSIEQRLDRLEDSFRTFKIILIAGFLTTISTLIAVLVK